MAKTNYLSLAGLQKYDTLIKSFVAAEDAKSIKNGVITDGVIKLYKTVDMTDTPIEIKLPEVDLSGLMTKIDATAEGFAAGTVLVTDAEGNSSDSKVALTDLATNVGVEAIVGTETLTTTAQTLKGAINELDASLAEVEELGAVSVTTDSTTEGYLKSYTVKQGDEVVGVIDIPKDLVVTSGEIVSDPDDDHVGTFIKLTIANQETPLYINVADLVDIYTAEQNAAQVQLTVSDANVISAVIVDGSVDTDALADGAVTTAKLDATLQESIGKADSAVQTVATGAAEGTIAVDGTDVAVNGYAALSTSVTELKELVGDGCDVIPDSDIAALFGTTAE